MNGCSLHAFAILAPISDPPSEFLVVAQIAGHFSRGLLKHLLG
jgi:hypothetical protein